MLSTTFNRRIPVLVETLKQINTNFIYKLPHRSYVSEASVSIGNVFKETKKPKRPEYVPKKYCKYLFYQVVGF